jgi:hypothetical protein
MGKGQKKLKQCFRMKGNLIKNTNNIINERKPAQGISHAFFPIKKVHNKLGEKFFGGI